MYSSAVRGENVQLIVTNSPFSIERGVSVLTIEFDDTVISTLFVALNVAAAAGKVALSASKIENNNVKARFILPMALHLCHQSSEFPFLPCRSHRLFHLESLLLSHWTHPSK